MHLNVLQVYVNNVKFHYSAIFLDYIPVLIAMLEFEH
jgi:hypothetical protein